MALITPVTLTIDGLANPQVNIQVSYQVHGSPNDIANGQHYHELCQLIGDDTPGDGADDLIRIPGARGPWAFDGITVFTNSAAGRSFTRVLSFSLPRSLLDEDQSQMLEVLVEDEIRARVTLTPVQPSRESNLVKVGGLGDLHA